jgi:hypothetical protein
VRLLVRWGFWGFLVCLFVGYVWGYQKPDATEFRGLAQRAGFSAAATEKALRVATCESGLRPRAVGDGKLANETWGPSIGPFQVRTRWSDPFGPRSPFLNFIPAFNATAAYKISNGGTDWSPWTCGDA